MLTNDELKEKIKKVHPEYLERDKKGGDKWKTARLFSTILYPENIDDIEKSCNDLQVPCCLSPLHDSDIKEDGSGELKKSHYHLVVYYKGKTTPYSFYVALVGAFGEKAFSTIQIGHDLGSLVAYHIHLNNPEKAQYNVNDIKDFNGFSSLKYIEESSGDTVSNFNKLMDIIDENNFLFLNEFLKYLRFNEPVLYSSVIRDRVLSKQVKDYIKAREYQMFFDGEIERSQVRIKNKDGSEKVIFNRQIKVV